MEVLGFGYEINFNFFSNFGLEKGFIFFGVLCFGYENSFNFFRIIYFLPGFKSVLAYNAEAKFCSWAVKKKNVRKATFRNFLNTYYKTGRTSGVTFVQKRRRKFIRVRKSQFLTLDTCFPYLPEYVTDKRVCNDYIYHSQSITFININHH